MNSTTLTFLQLNDVHGYLNLHQEVISWLRRLAVAQPDTFVVT